MKAPTYLPGHRMIAAGPLGSGKWKCECGKWEKETPKVGPYGRTSMRARMAQLNMAHHFHQKFSGKI